MRLSRLAVTSVLLLLFSVQATAQPPAVALAKKEEGIQPLSLVKLDKSKESPKTYFMPPGSVKAFTSGVGVVWILSPGAGANEKDLISFSLSGGSTAVGIDPDSGEFGRFQVPADQKAYILACNLKPKEPAGKFTLTKWLITATNPEPEKVAEAYIVIGGQDEFDKKKDDGKKTDPPGPQPAPKAKKVYIAIVFNPGNVDPALAKLIGDTSFWNEFRADGSDWDSYSYDSEDAVKKGYVDALKPVQSGASSYVPGLLVLDMTNGKKLLAEKLSTDKEEIRKLIRGVKN